MKFIFVHETGIETTVIASSVDEALQIIGDEMKDVVDILISRNISNTPNEVIAEKKCRSDILCPVHNRWHPPLPRQ